jgi:hypothetical protein
LYFLPCFPTPHTVWGRLPGSVFIFRGAESDIWICWSPFVFRLYDWKTQF